jgi:hypothetical protein
MAFQASALMAPAALRRGEGADFVAIEHDEAPAVIGEAVIGRRHAEAGGDVFQVLGCDGEVVIAEQEQIVVLQGVIDGQDGVEACEIAVDDVAQRDDEAQVFRIENLDRGFQFGRAVFVIAVHAGMRLTGGILRVGDDAEAEQRERLGHGAGLGGVGDRDVTAIINAEGECASGPLPDAGCTWPPHPPAGTFSPLGAVAKSHRCDSLS